VSRRIAVVGATGLVGRALLEVLWQRRFPADEVIAIASPAAAGRTVPFGDAALTVVGADAVDFSEIQLALFSAGSAVSQALVPAAAAAGCLVVDNASYYRMEPDVPLVVPEVNAEALADRPPRGIVANPNCSTIQLALVLKPLADAAGLEQVHVATYQAVSGAGRAAMTGLESDLRARLDGAAGDPDQTAFNVIPGIGGVGDEGYSAEEWKIVLETRKILGIPDLPVSATAVRVPVLNGHAEAVWLRTRDELVPEAARALLAAAPGILLVEDPEGLTPAALGAAEDRALVGRVRRDLAEPRGLVLWVVADNLRKGAATNAVQIAEILVKSYL
jgi:aspartate-semialdehyde dehydrogenase